MTDDHLIDLENMSREIVVLSDEIKRLKAEGDGLLYEELMKATAENERLRAECNLWRERAERMFWLLPDDVRLGEIQVNSALEPK